MNTQAIGAVRATPDTPTRLPSFAALGAAAFRLIGRIQERSWMGEATREIRRLEAMGDDDLARRGIRRREDIVLHVLGPRLAL